MNEERLRWDFDYHAPDPEKVGRHEHLRDTVYALALYFNSVMPDCREKSLAITKLEEAMFWANAAIARNERPKDAV